ncbi:MAG: Crp/Fnr family transcriptional regulator [Rhodospirillales bacterium]
MHTPFDQAVLFKTPFFAGLETPDRDFILARSVVLDVAKDTVLFHQGDPADCFFAVIQGAVKVYRGNPSGGETVLDVFKAGKTFADAALFMDGTYPATAQVIERARLCRIGRSAIEQAGERNPAVFMAVISSISGHLRHVALDLEQMKALTGKQRLARFLASLCGDGAQRDGNGGYQVRLPFDKSLLAARLGVRPESLSRYLADLKKAGVQVSGRSVSIRNLPDLMAIAEPRR